MPIKLSSARHIEALLADLRTDDPVAREAAIARLMVIGARAVERLGALASDTSAAAATRVAALRALEGIGDERALEIAIGTANDVQSDVAAAAISVVRTFLAGPHDLAAVDALTAIAMNKSRSDAVRETALGALGGLDTATLGPIVEALLHDSSARMRTVAKSGAKPVSRDLTGDGAVGADAWLDGERLEMPGDPVKVREAVTRHAGRIGLPRLHQMIERIREHEQKAAARSRLEWMRARAAAHVALATRGSRLAIYDLRESLDAARDPLPVEFLAALTMVGDTSCLEPLAGAYARTSNGAAKNDWWHRHLADAFHAIAARESVTRRHAAAKKIEKRWPDAANELWAARPRIAKADARGGRDA